MYKLSIDMLDIDNNDSDGLNLYGSIEYLGIEADSPSVDPECSSSHNRHHHAEDLATDSIAFTRVHLMSFRLLSHVEEHNLALELSSASRKIALLILSRGQSARELLNLLVTAITKTLDKSRLSSDESYFALRRELANLVNVEDNTIAVPLLMDALEAEMPHIVSGDKLSSTLIEHASNVDWPGPLMVAMAKRFSNKGTPTSTLELAINEYLSSTGTQANTERTPADKHSAQLKNQANRYLSARNKLVKHNLRLVFHVAKRYAQRSDHMTDLIQEGTCGLIRAAEKFRPAMGYRFSTYAYQWIEAKIRIARVNIERVIDISQEYNNDLVRISQWMQQQRSKNLPAFLHELPHALGISKERLDLLTQLKQYGLSLDSQSVDEGLSLHAKLADPDSNFVNTIVNERHADYLNSVMQSALTERECYVINERFGRLNSDSKTLQELSDILGISRERIRQLEYGALEKLSNWINNQA